MKRKITAALTAAFAFIGIVNSVIYLYELWKRPSTSEESASYFVGQQIGRNLRAQGLTLSESYLLRGLNDAYAGKLRLSEAELAKAQQEFSVMASKKIQEIEAGNQKKAEKFLDENKKNPGWVTTASGLQYHVLKEGRGRKPTEHSKLKIHYVGTLLDGTKFDSSRDKGAPGAFQLDQVIPGWKEVLSLMKEGSRWVAVLPPSLAYGPRGNGVIPPNAVLIFDMELLEVSK